MDIVNKYSGTAEPEIKEEELDDDEAAAVLLEPEVRLDEAAGVTAVVAAAAPEIKEELDDSVTEDKFEQDDAALGCQSEK
jgi:hypothetical protein